MALHMTGTILTRFGVDRVILNEYICVQAVWSVCPHDGGASRPQGRLPAPHVLHLADSHHLRGLCLHHQGGRAQVHEGQEALQAQAFCHRLQHIPNSLQFMGLSSRLEVVS